MRFLSIVGLWLCLCSLPAVADSGTARVGIRDMQFFVPQIPPVQSNEASFTAEYEKRFDISKRFSLQFHPYVYGSSIEESREHQIQFDPRSIYLEIDRKFGWLKAGYLTMKWEGTDGLNPMDIASMKDWGDPLLTETRASAAVAVGKSGDNYDFELAYIPRQTMWLLPGVKSPWLPRRFSFPLRTTAYELRIPDRIDYRYTPLVEIQNPLDTNVASRLQLRFEGVGDFALAFYDGLSDSPALEPVLDVTAPNGYPPNTFLLMSPAQITPIAYRVRTVSAFVSRAFDAWIVRASSRYDQPIGHDTRLPEWSQYSVVGVERSFDIGTNTVTALIEGAFVRAPESQSLFSIRDVFNHAVLFGLRYPMGENWTTMLSGFKSTRDTSYFCKLEIGRRFGDHWRVDLATELLDGPPASLLGVFGENDRAYVTLSGVY